jgi:hypothetical protein
MMVLAVIGATSAVRLLILLRGYVCEMLRKYGWFYFYISSGLVFDGVLGFIAAQPSLYKQLYWPFDFVTMAIGCGLVIEIFKHVLAPYPGADRFARIVCVITFGVIFVVGLIYPVVTTSEPTTVYQISLGRDVRLTQTVFFLVILAIIIHYAIPLGRNMSGMIYGYGLYLGTNLMTLAVRAYVGSDFNTAWRAMQSLSFMVSLLIWLWAFWVYAPNPEPRGPSNPDADYEAVARLTKERAEALRNYLGRPFK